MEQKTSKTKKRPDIKQIRRGIELRGSKKNTEKVTKFLENMAEVEEYRKELELGEYDENLSDLEVIFLYQYRKNRCVAVRACEAIGHSRMWLNSILSRKPLLSEIMHILKQDIVDEVENSLISNAIERNNVKAQMFFLETQAKDRGYSKTINDTSNTSIVSDIDFEEIR